MLPINQCYILYVPSWDFFNWIFFISFGIKHHSRLFFFFWNISSCKHFELAYCLEQRLYLESAGESRVFLVQRHWYTVMYLHCQRDYANYADYKGHLDGSLVSSGSIRIPNTILFNIVSLWSIINFILFKIEQYIERAFEHRGCAFLKCTLRYMIEITPNIHGY